MLDDQIGQDCLLLWLMDSPEICMKVLAAIESRLGGWCKLATKTGNQSGYVRVYWKVEVRTTFWKYISWPSDLPVNIVKIFLIDLAPRSAFEAILYNSASSTTPVDALHSCGNPSCSNASRPPLRLPQRFL